MVAGECVHDDEKKNGTHACREGWIGWMDGNEFLYMFSTCIQDHDSGRTVEEQQAGSRRLSIPNSCLSIYGRLCFSVGSGGEWLIHLFSFSCVVCYLLFARKIGEKIDCSLAW